MRRGDDPDGCQLPDASSVSVEAGTSGLKVGVHEGRRREAVSLVPAGGQWANDVKQRGSSWTGAVGQPR